VHKIKRLAEVDRLLDLIAGLPLGHPDIREARTLVLGTAESHLAPRLSDGPRKKNSTVVDLLIATI
jgi:hypothetical protein